VGYPAAIVSMAGEHHPAVVDAHVAEEDFRLRHNA